MNYVNEQNMQEILDGIARKIGQGGGSGAGLEDWQAEHEYIEKDICVYEGQIYRAKVGYTSDTTFSTIQILEEYEPVGGETIIPYEKDTEISIDDIVSYDNNTYKALYNFVCGEEFSLFALEEYVPKELTEVQEAEIINHFLPNIYSGGNMSVEDSTPIGTIISFMGTIAPENYLVCDGTIYNIADYIELAEFIKTQFGSYNYFGGDGITTFAVPDLQGEFLRMTGTNSHENQGSGANVGSHQDSTEIPFFGTYDATTKTALLTDTSTDLYVSNEDSGFKRGSGSENKWLVTSSTSAPSSTTANTRTIRPTNTSVLYCIKYKMSITNAEEIKDLTTEDIKQIISAYNPVFEEAKGVEYSTEERRIGTWIDGKPLYQKTFVFESRLTVSSTDWTQSSISIADNDIKSIIDVNVFVFNDASTKDRVFAIYPLLCSVNTTAFSNVAFLTPRNAINDSIDGVTLQYTKTTD